MSDWVGKYKSDINKSDACEHTKVLQMICNEVFVSDQIKRVDCSQLNIIKYLPAYHPLVKDNHLQSTIFHFINIKVDDEWYYFDHIEFKSVLNGMYFSKLPFLKKCWWLFNAKSFTDGDRDKSVVFESVF